MTRESPMIYARALADAELRNQVTAEERRWLTDHPLLWLRVLTQIRSEVENHIGQDRLRLSKMRPTSGMPSERYLTEKARVDERNANRMHFMTLVRRRKSEVIALCGVDPATPLIGNVVHAMVKIVERLDEDKPDSAREIAQACIEKWMSNG